METPRWLDTLGPGTKGKRPLEAKERKHENLDLLIDLENYLGKALDPYEERSAPSYSVASQKESLW